jgi:hypothetical protein
MIGIICYKEKTIVILLRMKFLLYRMTKLRGFDNSILFSTIIIYICLLPQPKHPSQESQIQYHKHHTLPSLQGSSFADKQDSKQEYMDDKIDENIDIIGTIKGNRTHDRRDTQDKKDIEYIGSDDVSYGDICLRFRHRNDGCCELW